MTSSFALPREPSTLSATQTVPGKSGRNSVSDPPGATFTVTSLSFAGSFTVTTRSFASPVIIAPPAAAADADGAAEAVSAGVALAMVVGSGGTDTIGAALTVGFVWSLLPSHAATRTRAAMRPKRARFMAPQPT